MNILFWNLANHELSSTIKECIEEQHVDIAFFAEFQKATIDRLAQTDSLITVDGHGGCDKVTVVFSKDYSAMVLAENARFIVYEFNTKENGRYIIACVHLASKIYENSEELRRAEILDLLGALSNVEKDGNNDKTIVLGDFNTEPYDDVMLSKIGFNAVLYKDEIMSRELVTQDGHRYRRFYNPCLESMSEVGHRYGSYRTDVGMVSPIWHFIDQVVMRRSVVTEFDHIEYLQKIGSNSLLKNKAPNKVKYSDHLPLIVYFKNKAVDLNGR